MRHAHVSACVRSICRVRRLPRVHRSVAVVRQTKKQGASVDAEMVMLHALGTFLATYYSKGSPLRLLPRTRTRTCVHALAHVSAGAQAQIRM